MTYKMRQAKERERINALNGRERDRQRQKLTIQRRKTTVNEYEDPMTKYIQNQQ